MGKALVALGFERPKQRHKLSAKEACITAIWAGLAVLIGMGIVTSVSVVSPNVSESSAVAGL